MALQTSGPISLNDVAGEFDGSAPHSLSEYYGVDDGVPGSGTISLYDFYGKSAAVEPEPEPELPYRSTGYSGAVSRTNYDNTPAFGGMSYISAYSMAQNSGVSGGIGSAGLFTEGIGDPSGSPTGLGANAFSRILIVLGGGQWTPLSYTTISIGISGNGMANGGWSVYNPIWSRYQPPGTSGFSNLYYLSSASGTAPIFGPAANGDSVGTIGQYMAQAMDAGGAGIGIDFQS